MCSLRSGTSAGVVLYIRQAGCPDTLNARFNVHAALWRNFIGKALNSLNTEPLKGVSSARTFELSFALSAAEISR